MAAVEIQGLTKSYGDNQVLSDLNIEVGDGEFLTLLGPSGCGKTTTLRCVAGLERADGGEIRIGGTVVASGAGRVFVPPNKRDIGMVFQSYALWPHMTVAGNIAYPLRMRRKGGGDVRRQVAQILETVGMAAFAQRHVTDLSGGQQQRVALARAMVAKPGLLLFDEPLSNLDAKLRRDMRREIRAAHDASGGASVYVTHDQEEAITLSDRVVVLRGGVVQQVGTPRDIYEHPVNTFVADFVGYDNILAGTVAGTSARGCTVTLTEAGDAALSWRPTARSRPRPPAGAPSSPSARSTWPSSRCSRGATCLTGRSPGSSPAAPTRDSTSSTSSRSASSASSPGCQSR